MSAFFITRDEIIDAISRVDALNTYSPVAHHAPQDGTYKLYASWVGSARVWMAAKLVQESGYEVAYQEITDDAWYALDEARFGIWTDPDTGEIVLDRTVNIQGSYGVAEAIGQKFDQKAIWWWSAGKSVSLLTSIDDI